VKIRESVENDRKSIRKVHKNAFDQSEGEIVAQLAIDPSAEIAPAIARL